MSSALHSGSRKALPGALAWAWWMMLGCVLLFGTGGTALVHAHDDHGAHVHLLGRATQHNLANAHAAAHQQEHCGHETPAPADGPQVSDPQHDDLAVLVSLPEWLVTRERGATTAWVLLPLPARAQLLVGEARSARPMAAWCRRRPAAFGRSGHARLLLTNHAILT